MKPAAALAALTLLAACAGGPDPVSAPTTGYLGESALEALAEEVPDPAFDPESEATAFAVTQPGTDRWWLAVVHAELRPPEALQHFDCALGTRLMQRPRPALARLFDRLLVDAGALTRRLAAQHPRERPVAALPDLQSCQRVDDTARRSPSWPAGGAVAGAVWSRALAEIAPDRAASVSRAGRELGLSRVVCRMAWPSDAADGARLGEALYADLQDDPDFHRDLEAARAEVAAAREEGLGNPGCAAERRAYGDPSWGLRPGEG